MADTKISALTDGVTANATDQIPVARSGANRYVTPAYVRTYIIGQPNTFVGQQTIAAIRGDATGAATLSLTDAGGSILKYSAWDIIIPGSAIQFRQSSVAGASIDATLGHVKSASGGMHGWTSTSGSGTFDTTISRKSAGVAQVGSGSSAGENGSLDLAWLHTAGQKRVTSQFDKTDTTLADITGLSVTVTAGKTYAFRATLPITASAGGGHKVAIGGTATATAIIYQTISINNASAGALVVADRHTALGGASGEASGATEISCTLEGTITVSAGGTLTVQFAQNSASGTSSVLVGASLVVHEF